MTEIDTDIAHLINDRFKGRIEAYTVDTLGNHTDGVLVEMRQTGGSVDIDINTETGGADITVKMPFLGIRGTDRAQQIARELYHELKLILDTTINGTYYGRITADTPVHRVAGGEVPAPWSAWRFGLEIEREL